MSLNNNLQKQYKEEKAELEEQLASLEEENK
jgi:hypothetical protein